jgi:demethylmenaquinone methyltransferase/2-methoxy-6-polyprenyl-1,4-benzoquinol methylase
MLDLARSKARPLVLERAILFVQGDAGRLPFAEASFDCIGISFGFRNLTYRNRLRDGYLAEMLRVLHPGGRLVILETSQPDSRLIRGTYRVYLRWIVPWLGSLLSGQRGAYEYLAQSAAGFFSAEEISDMLTAAGFRQVSFRPLLLGVSGIHVAVR